MNTPKEIHLIIEGRVQGVSYRYSTQKKAQSLGLNGWVKNLPNGNVELIAQGPTEALTQLEQWCWQGPPMAEVTQVQVLAKGDAVKPLHRFKIQS